MSLPQSDEDLSDRHSRSQQSNDDPLSEDSSSSKAKRRLKCSSPKTEKQPSGSGTETLATIESTSCNVPKPTTTSDNGNSSDEDIILAESGDSASEDFNSVVSDVNPPSFATRLRQQKQVGRKKKGSSSTSSASESRKAVSEPVLIDMDSESERDDLSVATNRPNRMARVQGELIRKLGRFSQFDSNKGDESSSSETSKKGKRRKKKSKVSSASQAGTVRKYPKRQMRVLSGHKQTKRLKIRKLRAKINRTKNISVFRTSRALLRKCTQKNAFDQKRISRRRSCTVVRGSYCEDDFDKKDGRLKKNRVGRKSSKESLDDDNKKNDIEDDIRKISAARPNIQSRFKNNSDRNTYDDSDRLNSESENEDSELNTEAKLSENLYPLKIKQEETAQNIQLDLEKIKSGRPEDVEGQSSGAKNSNSDLPVTRSHKKKKMRDPTDPKRRRGRPRIYERPSYNEPLKDLLPYNVKPHVPFLQNTFCFDVSQKLSKCRECRIASHRNSRRLNNSYCRFMEYRKLCCSKNGVISSIGFSNPSDATAEHLSEWLPQPKNRPTDLNFKTAKSLVEHTGDQFCDLIEQEKEALSLHIGTNQVMTWKRLVQGVREMCDVCSTTIFNIHWVCPICGFAVCIDCYKVRKQGIITEDEEEQARDRDEYNWLLCSQRQSHDQKNLVMAQIVAGKALWIMRDLVHKARIKHKIPSYCKCQPQKDATPGKQVFSGINKQLMSSIPKSFSSEKCQYYNFDRNVCMKSPNYSDLDVEVSLSALKWLDDFSLEKRMDKSLRPPDDNYKGFEDLKLILNDSLMPEWEGDISKRESSGFSLDDIIASVTNFHTNVEKNPVKHFNQRYPQPNSGRDPLPIRIYTKIESELSFHDIPHSWFCNGRLLFLHKADHPDNLSLFQEQWKRGQPIVVKSVDESLDMNLWHPDSFCRDFGEVRNDLVDCKTGAVLKNLPMKKFWEGFENFGKRLTDGDGDYMLLKLKDWPPGEDFSEKLPTRYDDLMKGLPLPEYTHRDGILNLAGRLPSSFVRPDLGPKMYNAYGSALYPTKGTTNLHLDVSDAVNVMVYVGIPSDGNAQLHIQEALKAIDEGGCDSLMRVRVRNKNTKPGALWHIYNARDADKIRDLLTKVAIERGEKLEAHHDPIHDQSWYLDAELRLRLYREYGVEGYAIAQCLGDAVFIPAGAPHQVRNLHSCVKVAEDFVSPENIAHCFKLTQEFRNLSDTHTNHEDKLQIKNIIYHVVRDSLSYLLNEDECVS